MVPTVTPPERDARRRPKDDGRSVRRGQLPTPQLLAGVLLILGACGDQTTASTPSLSLVVVPSPITFSVLSRPTPECCTILAAQWRLMVSASASGDLLSVSITLQNPVSGYVYVDRRSDRSQLGTQAPAHLEADTPLAIPQALLETMPPQFWPGEPLRLRVEVAFRSGGQTVTAAIEPPFVVAP
jgi:hypothetical protein